MKSFAVIAFLASIIVPHHVALAADSVSAGIGANVWPRTSNSDELEASSTPGPALMLAIGKHASPKVAHEVEFSYRRNDVHGINVGGVYEDRRSGDGNRIHGISVHANIKGTVFKLGPFSAYALAGVGVTHVTVRNEYTDSGNEINDSDAAPSAQIGAGIAYAFYRDLILSIDYRHMRPVDMSISWDGNALETNYDARSIYISAKIMH